MGEVSQDQPNRLEGLPLGPGINTLWPGPGASQPLCKGILANSGFGDSVSSEILAGIVVL
jgi:hypothetical protein